LVHHVTPSGRILVLWELLLQRTPKVTEPDGIHDVEVVSEELESLGSVFGSFADEKGGDLTA
jgi:hypothetical protein